MANFYVDETTRDHALAALAILALYRLTAVTDVG